MSDEGLTWRYHLDAAEDRVCDAWHADDRNDIDSVRAYMVSARASLTRALLLLPALEDKDAA